MHSSEHCLLVEAVGLAELYISTLKSYGLAIYTIRINASSRWLLEQALRVLVRFPRYIRAQTFIDILFITLHLYNRRFPH